MKDGASLRVREVMTTQPSTIDGMATVEAALAMMRDRSISSLVVDRRDPGDEYGLVLVSDIAREAVGRSRPVSRIQVYEVMQKPAPYLTADMKLKYAVRQMSRFGLTHCIVLDGRDMVGIVSLRDMTVRFLEAAT
ncbi:MAG: CBS domain-containing protein [Bauldia sp.]|nr:CBS domain-containing protein [Bauldia sp.]